MTDIADGTSDLARDRGIIFAASQHPRYVCEAIAAAEAVKRWHPQLPLVLFTDVVERRTLPPFAAVLPIPSPDIITGTDRRFAWARGVLAAASCLPASPYRQTIYLDGDLRVLSPGLQGLFDILADCSIAMIPCTPTNSRSCAIYGPMFNAGVIAYEKNAETDHLFRAWIELQCSNLLLAMQEPPGVVPYLAHLDSRAQRFLLGNTQTSLARLLSPCYNKFNVSLKILDHIWNARNLPRNALNGVIIDHADCHKFRDSQVAPFLAERGLDDILASA